MADSEQLGRDYLLHEELGRGAFAIVRRATHRLGGPALAAKALRPEFAGDRRVRDLFLREEAALRDLEHESIVSIRDLVVERGQLVLLMDLVDGPNLRDHLGDRGGRLPVAEAAAIAAQAAAALAAAHGHGVIHLDLKPENILVVRGASPPIIRLSDFGVAALLLDARGGGDAPVGSTPGYTAPEVASGGPATAAADVYALGVVLAEMVTGERPVPETGDPAPRAGVDPGHALTGVPDPLRGLVRRCLAGDPRDRPSARVLAVKLRAAAAELAAAAPASTEPTAATAAPGSVAGEPVETRLRPRASASAVAAAEVPATPRRRIGPLVTLLAGGLVAAALITVSLTAAADERAGRDTTATRDAPVSAAPATEATQPTQPSPSPPTNAPPEPARATYAGRVAGGDATLAITVRDGRAIAYICDGKRLEEWLQGTATGGRLALTGPDDASLTGMFDDRAARGAVVENDRRQPFEIRVAKKPSGLYRTAAQVRDARVQGSWIVLADGTQVGVLSRGDTPGPAPSLDTTKRTATVDGKSVTATAVNGETGEGF